MAELFRIKKDFDNAEPLYLEAIDILEKHFWNRRHKLVGAALHNLGQFYLVQRKLEKARVCYEFKHALKIKRRVLGESHVEYADTMYHLGRVLYLKGDEKVSVDLIADSIRILEAAGQGESFICFRRMQQLAQMYTKSNRFAEAEALLRKILHIMELSKVYLSSLLSIQEVFSGLLQQDGSLGIGLLTLCNIPICRHYMTWDTSYMSDLPQKVSTHRFLNDLGGWKSLDTVLVAELLALALETAGRLREAEELLGRCLDARRNLLPDDHIQV
ncbi:hypothetical protein OROGR_008193 [Orobanche gracilis]